jgi:hypothetical protein
MPTTHETVTTWLSIGTDHHGTPVTRESGEADPLPRTFAPPRPDGEGWRCVGFGVFDGLALWTWERPTPAAEWPPTEEQPAKLHTTGDGDA